MEQIKGVEDRRSDRDGATHEVRKEQSNKANKQNETRGKSPAEPPKATQNGWTHLAWRSLSMDMMSLLHTRAGERECALQQHLGIMWMKWSIQTA